jgi:pimeloyl-ACP methyl ester carboxylesterase
MKPVAARVSLLLVVLLSAGAGRASDFTPCADDATLPGLSGSVCRTVAVPMSYDAASANSPQAEIFVRKFPAAGRAKGSVWLVSGGPGESGASLYPMLGTLRQAFPGFDLLIPDHRGTGYSSRLCPQEEAVGSPGGMALAGAEWGSCFQRLGSQPGIAGDFSITSAARDLSYLLGQSDKSKPVYIYGVSYGTQLVLRALQLGDVRFSGVILDSLVPLQTASAWDLSQRSKLVDAVGRKVLAQCDADPKCHAALGEDAATLYQRVLAKASATPAMVADIPGKNLKRFLGGALDVPAARQRIPYLIKDLEAGRRDELKLTITALEAAGASLGDYPQTPPSIPLVSIISASENNLRPDLTLAELTQEEERLLFSSRLPELLVKPALPAYPRDAYFGKPPARLPPLLVLNGTLDPKTSYEGALEHVAVLRKIGKVNMVTVTGAPHFILWTAPDCFVRHARDFIDGRSAESQTCSPGL